MRKNKKKVPDKKKEENDIPLPILILTTFMSLLCLVLTIALYLKIDKISKLELKRRAMMEPSVIVPRIEEYLEREDIAIRDFRDLLKVLVNQSNSNIEIANLTIALSNSSLENSLLGLFNRDLINCEGQSNTDDAIAVVEALGSVIRIKKVYPESLSSAFSKVVASCTSSSEFLRTTGDFIQMLFNSGQNESVIRIVDPILSELLDNSLTTLDQSILPSLAYIIKNGVTFPTGTSDVVCKYYGQLIQTKEDWIHGTEKHLCSTYRLLSCELDASDCCASTDL